MDGRHGSAKELLPPIDTANRYIRVVDVWPNCTPHVDIKLGVSLGSSYYQVFELSDGFFFGDAVNQSDFSGQAIKCRRVKLSFAIALTGIDSGPIKIAHYFPDGDDVARIDLAFVCLRQSGPITPRFVGHLTQGPSNALDSSGIG